jgi:hypothetical protein
MQASPDGLTHSDIEIIRCAYRRVALEASSLEVPFFENQSFSNFFFFISSLLIMPFQDSLLTNDQLQQVQNDIDGIEKFIHKMLHESNNFSLKIRHEQITGLPPLLSIPNKVNFEAFPRFDCFRRDTDVEKFAGKPKLPPIFRPVQFTLVPEKATNYHEVQLALRHCHHISTLLSYQTNTIDNSYLHRVALIQYTMLRVIPIPLPLDHPDRERLCFYAQPLRYSDQVDILKTLMMVARHFTASAMSLDLTRAFDATRVLTMSCMAVLADTVSRIKASDTPSRFSMHLDGKGEGPFPQVPFGFDVSLTFAKQSESMLFCDPNQVAVRTKVGIFSAVLFFFQFSIQKMFFFSFRFWTIFDINDALSQTTILSLSGNETQSLAISRN